MDSHVYAHNMERYFELNNFPDAVYMSQSQLIDHLVYVAHEKRKVLASNNAFIEEILVPFEKGLATPTDEDLTTLKDIFNSIYVNGVFYDRGTSERIVHIIYNAYLKAENYDKAARQLQFIYYFDIINNSHQALGRTTFAQGLADEWVNYYDKLSTSGKLAFISFLLATVYNENDKKHALHRMERAVDYIHRENVDVFDSSNQQFFCAYRSALADLLGHVCDAMDDDNRCYSQEEMERIDFFRSQFIDEHREGHLEMFPFSVDATIKRLAYYFGEITQEELLTWLLTYAGEESKKGDSKSLINALSAEANYFSTIRYNFTGSRTRKEALWDKALKEILPTFRQAVKTKDDFYVYDTSAQLVQILSSQLGFEKARNYVFDITVFHDKSLSIHTVIVSKISHIILEEVLRSRPDFLDGVAGYSKDYIEKNPAAVLQLMRECALFHDIGKHYCLDYVQTAFRSLTDREFSMIKCHSEDFEKFFPVTDYDTPELTCIRDCAVLHHTWHDGTGGYPLRPHTKNRPFVDILSIADSIDAATDVIGRPYTKGKSLDALIEEFLSFADTRYSLLITELLKKPEVKSQIQLVIDEGRKEITFAAYTDNLKI